MTLVLTLVTTFALAGLPQASAPRPAKPPAVPPAQLEKSAAAAREAGRLAEATQLYRRLTQAKPRQAEAWWFLGTLQYEQDQFAPARDAMRRFVTLEPASAAGFAILGLCEFETREFAPALDHLEKALALGLPPGEQLTLAVHYHAMILQNRAGNFERSLQLASFAARQPQDATPDFLAAAGLAALRRIEFPSEIAPEDRELVFKMGRAMLLAAERRSAEAEKLMQEIADTYPRTPNVNYAHASFLLAFDPDRGLPELRKELALNPDHLPALVSLAAELLKRGEAEAAIDPARRARALAPDNFVTRTMLGRVLTATGDLATAIAELESSRQMAPDSPQVRFALGAAYAKAGRREEAQREREEFLRLKKLMTPGVAAETP